MTIMLGVFISVLFLGLVCLLALLSMIDWMREVKTMYDIFTLIITFMLILCFLSFVIIASLSFAYLFESIVNMIFEDKDEDDE